MTLFKKVLRLFLCFYLLISLMLIVTAAAFGGKWNSAALYHNSSNNVYSSQVNTAATAWNNFLSHGSSGIRLGQAPAVTATITVSSGFYGLHTFVAYGQPGPNPNSGFYSYGTIWFNRSYTQDFESDKPALIQALAAHETGHILGLEHIKTSQISIMHVNIASNYGSPGWTFSSPLMFDRANLLSIYP